MPEPHASQVARRIAAEALLWAAIAGAFLAIYVGLLGVPAASILPHLRLVLDAALVVAGLRLIVALAGLPPAVARLLASLLFVAALAALLLFYAAALVGLRSWGRVSTWELIASYVPQSGMLLEAVGIPVAVGAAVGALVLAACVAAGWGHGRRFDWTVPAATRFPRGRLALLSLALLAGPALDLHRVTALPPVAEQEPFSLMMFPQLAAVAAETQGLDRAASARREAAEAQVRAAYRPATGFRPRNVVIVVSDALRADHMAVYGYGRDTTPRLSRLVAAGAARVAPAVRAACSESLCGLLALASSRYVHQFAPRMFVLHEVLAAHGYRTVMILGGDHTHFYGLREQYGAVDSYFDASAAGAGYMNDDRVVIEQAARLPRWDGRPVLVQFHLMSSHMLGKRHDESAVFQPAANYFFPANRMDGGRPAAKAVNFYDDGVREADAVIGRLVDQLLASGYLDDAIVVITADHGEALGEHGHWGHQRGVYDEVIRVPFVVLDFGPGPRRPLDGAAAPSQVDIAPTILEELGIPEPSSWSGRPLQAPSPGGFIFFEQGPIAGLLDRRDPRHLWKFWEDRASGARFAYDVSVDPGERDNAVARIPAELQRDWQLALLPMKAQYVGAAPTR